MSGRKKKKKGEISQTPLNAKAIKQLIDDYLSSIAMLNEEVRSLNLARIINKKIIDDPDASPDTKEKAKKKLDKISKDLAAKTSELDQLDADKQRYEKRLATFTEEPVASGSGLPAQPPAALVAAHEAEPIANELELADNNEELQEQINVMHHEPHEPEDLPVHVIDDRPPSPATSIMSGTSWNPSGSFASARSQIGVSRTDAPNTIGDSRGKKGLYTINYMGELEMNRDTLGQINKNVADIKVIEEHTPAGKAVQREKDIDYAQIQRDIELIKRSFLPNNQRQIENAQRRDIINNSKVDQYYFPYLSERQQAYMDYVQKNSKKVLF